MTSFRLKLFQIYHLRPLTGTAFSHVTKGVCNSTLYNHWRSNRFILNFSRPNDVDSQVSEVYFTSDW